MITDLDLLVEKTHELEPLPPSVGRLASIVADADWKIDEVVQLISYDQALTGMMLRAANSAASASRIAIVSVKDAIVRLGSGTVLSLVTGSYVCNAMRRAIPEYGLSEGELWRHSVAAALAAENTRAFCRTRVPAESFAVALLHDIGKLAMSRFLNPEDLGMLVQARQERGLSFLEAEKDVVGMDHAELGGIIMQNWGLPEPFRIGVAYHETPDVSKQVYSDVVHLGDVVAKRIGAGTDDQAQARLLESVRERLGISVQAVKALCDRVSSRLEKVLTQYE